MSTPYNEAPETPAAVTNSAGVFTQHWSTMPCRYISSDLKSSTATIMQRDADPQLIPPRYNAPSPEDSLVSSSTVLLS